jgi:uncharacterized membrane protein
MAATPQPRTWLLGLILLLSLAGFADAAYLTAKHYTGGPVPCTLTGGCEDVLTSRWATLGGVPTAVFGAAYYLLTFFLTIFYLDSRKHWTLTLILALTAAALAVSLALVYLMAFVIGSYCQYCLLSDLMTALLFAASLAAVLLRRKARLAISTSKAASARR